MIPAPDHPRWKELVTGKVQGPFDAISLNLMLNRVVRLAEKDASSANLEKLVGECHAFFTKYDKILESDRVRIFGR
ncbi:MAG: hypothetical protein P1V51_08300 [Deltaproteobacteria bacterium]|nr:hypothetical protein [Deltaproteobacteria bacterium]